MPCASRPSKNSLADVLNPVNKMKLDELHNIVNNSIKKYEPSYEEAKNTYDVIAF